MKTNQENTQVEKKLTYAEICALDPADLYAANKVKVVKPFKGLDAAKAFVSDSLKTAVKYVAAMKRRFNELREEHAISHGDSFKKFYGDNVGGKLPGRVETLAVFFNTTVEIVPQLLTEENFDAAKPEWLEKANSIFKRAQKELGEPAWKTCDDVIDAVTALRKTGVELAGAGETLKEISKRQKGETGETAETPIAISFTPAMAADLLILTIQHAGDMPPEKSRELFQLTQDINAAWKEPGVTKYVSKDQQRGWFDEIRAAKAAGVAPHVVVVKTEITVPEVAEQVAA